MGCRGGLSALEKSIINSQLGEGKSTLEISKNIGRYHQTVKNFVKDLTKVRKRVDKGESGVLSRRSLSRIKREVIKNPGQTSKELFDRIVMNQMCQELPEAEFWDYETLNADYKTSVEQNKQRKPFEMGSKLYES